MVGRTFRVEIGLASLTALLVLTACQPAPQSCGDPTTLRTPDGHPDAVGAIAGPLIFSGFGATGDATIADWKPGTIQKVLIRHIATSGEVTVSGTRCTDNKALRLWYRDSAPFTLRDASSTPLPVAVLETTGDERVVFPPTEVGPVILPAHMGYMFFTTAGKWRIDVASQGTVASIVVRVGAP